MFLGTLAHEKSALYALSVRQLALSPKAPTVGAVRLPPHNPSRDCTCLKLVVIIGGHFLRIRDGSRSDAGLPTGDFHPISSCPCRAYQVREDQRKHADRSPLSHQLTINERQQILDVCNSERF